MLNLRRTTAALVLSLGVLAAACGGSNGDSAFGDGSGDGGGGGGGPGGGGFGGGNGNGNGEGGAGNGGEGGVCNAPVDMFIMFDRSGSMGKDCNIGDTTTSKWCRSINALSGYFNGAGSKDQAAAIQFFPLDNHTDALCTTGDSYNVAALPGADFTTLPSASFDALLNSTSPNTNGTGAGTPTEAAIRGLTRFSAANRRPGRVTIAILITDGDPNGCDQNLTHLSDLLDAHYKATTIRTYVIGMQGATFSNLEKIAVGGNAPTHPDAVGAITDACGNGAGPCLAWNVGGGDPAVFTAALAAIQSSADGCKPGGGTINPTK